MPRRDRTPRFYFSLRSPYSWLAYRQLRDEHPEVADAITWRPFWEPDARSLLMLEKAGGGFPYVAMSRAKHLYILQDVRRLCSERGLEPVWPVDRDPVWEVPHLAHLAAVDAGKGPEFVERVYRARWEEGRDICAPATIAEVAAELGLPEDRLAGAADDDELRERGVEALLRIDADGVFGVPFFIHGFHKFWGVDRLAAFIASVTGAAPGRPDAESPDTGLSDTAPSAAAPGRGGDQGHAGGCG
ncbi:2-hydroxychromene-2-carboxylate isomerase [Streptomyces sp. Inha503]|uniref:2-hydroxychromene-2-carboxylate isomerase n=1 Tax=Streptomyces sp. Inha503 TaxID=3383314 RepID=UPI0039A0F95D